MLHLTLATLAAHGIGRHDEREGVGRSAGPTATDHTSLEREREQDSGFGFGFGFGLGLER